MKGRIGLRRGGSDGLLNLKRWRPYHPSLCWFQIKTGIEWWLAYRIPSGLMFKILIRSSMPMMDHINRGDISIEHVKTHWKRISFNNPLIQCKCAGCEIAERREGQ